MPQPEEKKPEEKPEEKPAEKKPEGEPEKKSIEDLAKDNPELAKLIEERKALQDKIDAEETARKAKEAEETKAREEAAAKNGEWEKLAKEREARIAELEKDNAQKSDHLDKYILTTNTTLENIMQTIPEENRGLIPEDFSPRQKLEYITKNAKLLGAKVSEAKGGSVPPNDKQPAGTEEERLQSEFNDLQKKVKDGTATAAESASLFQKAVELKKARLNKS